MPLHDYIFYAFVLLCCSIPYIFVDSRFLIGTSNPATHLLHSPTLDQSIFGLSLPYAHSRSTRAIQSVLYLFSAYTTCLFPRFLSTLVYFFPDFFCYAHTHVLCTLLCVCSLSLSTLWNVITWLSLSLIFKTSQTSSAVPTRNSRLLSRSGPWIVFQDLAEICGTELDGISRKDNVIGRTNG